MVKVVYACVVILTLGVIVACGSIYEKEPVGIGKEYSELKKSPCACLKLDMVPELPEWVS